MMPADWACEGTPLGVGELMRMNALRQEFVRFVSFNLLPKWFRFKQDVQQKRRRASLYIARNIHAIVDAVLELACPWADNTSVSKTDERLRIWRRTVSR